MFDSSLKHFIDGKLYIRKIAKKSNVDINAVRMLITHLLYYKVVSIVDIFSFNNIYKVTSQIKEFLMNWEL